MWPPATPALRRTSDKLQGPGSTPKSSRMKKGPTGKKSAELVELNGTTTPACIACEACQRTRLHLTSARTFIYVPGIQHCVLHRVE